jgi:hypothetical protein
VTERRDLTQIGNVVRLLDRANEEQGLRYFLKPGAMPDLRWTAEVATKLIGVVELRVNEVEGPKLASSGAVAAFMIVFGKPVSQNKPSE